MNFLDDDIIVQLTWFEASDFMIDYVGGWLLII